MRKHFPNEDLWKNYCGKVSETVEEERFKQREELRRALMAEGLIDDE